MSFLPITNDCYFYGEKKVKKLAVGRTVSVAFASVDG